MSKQDAKISQAFFAFRDEAPEHAKAWMELVQKLSAVNALTPKTAELAYIAVLAALRRESGIPFHVQAAKKIGASREEIISAILVGLPAAGHVVTQVLPIAMNTFDNENVGGHHGKGCTNES